jgi:hypothetical protein
MGLLREAVRRNDQEMEVCGVFKSQHTPTLGPTCAADVGQTPHSTGASAKLPSHCFMRVSPVSCLKNAMIGKAFEDVGTIKNTATQQLLQMY